MKDFHEDNIQDESLVNDFLSRHRQEIEDRDFSRHVMRKIPHRQRRMDMIFQCVGYGLAILLFFWADGFSIVYDILCHTVEHLAPPVSNPLPMIFTVIASLYVLFFVALYNIVANQK